MALVLGTNCGFVAVAPTTDPNGDFNQRVDGRSCVVGDTSPAGAVRIIEFGWYDNTAGTAETNFEIGLYAADGAVVPGEAGTLLFVSRTNAKGTSGGWHVVTGLNWTISGNTKYWFGVQADTTATATNTDASSPGSVGGYDVRTTGATTTLPNPFGGGAITDTDGVLAFYAVYQNGYTIDATVGTFALTGISLSTLYHRVAALSAGAFSLTGINIATTYARAIVASVGQFILTGIDAILRYSNPYTNEQKHSTSFTNTTKNATSMTNQTKNATSFTNTTKEDGTTFTNQAKNATTFTNTDKS